MSEFGGGKILLLMLSEMGTFLSIKLPKRHPSLSPKKEKKKKYRIFRLSFVLYLLPEANVLLSIQYLIHHGNAVTIVAPAR